DDTYTFNIRTEGGVRLRVNGQTVIDSLTPKDRIRRAIGSIDLTGGQKYNLVLEYVHNVGTAQIDMQYSNSTVALQTVGHGQLFPPASTQATLPPIGDAYVN